MLVRTTVRGPPVLDPTSSPPLKSQKVYRDRGQSKRETETMCMYLSKQSPLLRLAHTGRWGSASRALLRSPRQITRAIPACATWMDGREGTIAWRVALPRSKSKEESGALLTREHRPTAHGGVKQRHAAPRSGCFRMSSEYAGVLFPKHAGRSQLRLSPLAEHALLVGRALRVLPHAKLEAVRRHVVLRQAGSELLQSCAQQREGLPTKGGRLE